MAIGRSSLKKIMEYIKKKIINIFYSPYEIMLFTVIWTYGLFGAFITRSDNNLLLIFSSIIALSLSYIFLILDHNYNKKRLEISFSNIKIALLLFVSILLLLNDGIFSWFYNDQSAHVTEAFKHGIFLGKILPEIENLSYKTFIYIINLCIFLFFTGLIVFFRNQKNLYIKISILTIVFLFLRIGMIYSGGTQSMHPPLRLFPIFFSSILFGINEIGIRIFQLIIVSIFLSYFLNNLKKDFSALHSGLFLGVILTTPLFLFTSLSIEPSIYAFMILTIFLIDIYINTNHEKFDFFKWIFIISVGSLIRQSIFLLFIPLFIMYLLQKNKIKENLFAFISPLFLSTPIFLYSVIGGTPSTNNLGNNNFLSHNYIEIFINNLNIFLFIFLLIGIIPNFKKSKNSFILLITFVMIFLAFIVVPFYGYEFTYRYHVEYALPFAILGLYKVCLYLEKKSYKKSIPIILILSIIINIKLYIPIFAYPNEVTFKSLLANNFSLNHEVYDFISQKKYTDQFYYIGTNERLVSKIIYGLSIQESLQSTKSKHFNVGTFGTDLNFEDLDQIIKEYNIIVIDIFDTQSQTYPDLYTVSYDIDKHHKIAEYLSSKNFENKKIFHGKMGFKTLIFINEKN